MGREIVRFDKIEVMNLLSIYARWLFSRVVNSFFLVASINMQAVKMPETVMSNTGMNWGVLRYKLA